MKKVLLAFLVIAFSANGFSQGFDKSKLRVGGGLSYASEISNVGLSVNGVYYIGNPFEASLAFTHFFKKNYTSWNVLDLDGHYIFHESDVINVYGLAGLGFNFWNVTVPAMELGWGISTPEMSESGTDIGLNLGVGMNYAISETLNLMPELRYTIADGGFFRIGATVQYCF
jgi:opacity protein-like surface antigen